MRFGIVFSTKWEVIDYADDCKVLSVHTKYEDAVVARDKVFSSWVEGEEMFPEYKFAEA